jgi:hypothetical protein
MRSLYYLFPTLFAISISFLIVRAAAIALMLTGLDIRKAKFQALSAFSGTGFTTKESEAVVNHPMRRKIITGLIILGNVGIVTVIVTTTSSLVTSRMYELPINIAFLLSGTIGLYLIASRRGYIKKFDNYIEKKLIKSSAFEEGTTEDLLHLIEGYGLIKAIITDESELVGKTLAQGKLTAKGILVLGIERGGSWVPIPKGDTIIQLNDRLVLYGSLPVLRELFTSPTPIHG